MKKVLSILICLCMVCTALPMAVLAEGENAAKTPGDMVWSLDFQDADLGDFMSKKPDEITFIQDGSGGETKAEVAEAVTGNKYLHYYINDSAASAQRVRGMSIKAPDAAKDNTIYTFEADIKLDPYDAGTMSVDGSNQTEYNLGCYRGNGAWDMASYFTLNPKEARYAGDTGTFYLNGNRTPNGTVQHKLSEGADAHCILRPYAWNTYRFVVRKNNSNQYFMDVYLNGWYFYRVGQRNNTIEMPYVQIAMLLKSGVKYGGVSIDNLKFYYGAAEADGAQRANGKFTVDNYDFNNLEAQTYECNGSNYSDANPILQGANVDHNLGALRRYSNWEMNFDIKRGIGGKSSEDSSLTVSGRGRLNFDRQEWCEWPNSSNGQKHNNYEISTTYATALNEGETLEIASDVMFNSTNDALTFQAKTSSQYGGDRVAIQVTPNYYGHGHWDADDFQNHRREIVPGLPLGKWIRMKLIITRGTSETANKYSIYADNIPIVENADLEYWYTDESFTDGAVAESPEMLTGNALTWGFENMYFNGNASYDNITFNRYLGGEQYVADTQVPVILAESNLAGAMPSIRGKVFAGDCSVAEILSQFSVAGDPAVAAYIVRDGEGNEVSDYNTAAGGNYIDVLTTGGEHLYVTLAANSYRQNITDSGTGETGALGDFALNGITAESITAGYGRLADDKSIKLSNTSSEKISAKYTVDSYDNNLIEFSFLPDADTDFRFGYDMLYVADDGTDREGARQKNTGFKRTYPEVLTISGGKVICSSNDIPLEVGSYNAGEWTKVKLVFNHGGGNSVWMSVNDGTAVRCDNGPSAYIYKLSDVYLTLSSGKNVIVDDIKIIDGAKPEIDAPAITGSEDEEVILREKSIIVSDGLSGFVANTFADFKKSPVNAIARYIRADGSIITDLAQDETAIDKYVLVNNDTYIYYTVDFYDFENFDKIIVDGNNVSAALISSTASEAQNAKLLTAVYTNDGQLRVSKVTNLTLTSDRGVPTVSVSNYADPELLAGDKVMYYIWNMDTLRPLCSSLLKE